MQITLKVKESNGSVIQSYRKLGTTVPKRAKMHLRAVMDIAKMHVATYPATLPGQQYVRTGEYGRGVKIVDVTELQIELQTMAVESRGRKRRAYHTYVSGNAAGEGQAPIHQKRWKKPRDEVEEAARELIRRVEEDIRNGIR